MSEAAWMRWVPIEELTTEPLSHAISALLWCRLLVCDPISGIRWWTEWKILQAQWFKGRGFAPCYPESWQIGPFPPDQIEKIEATHVMMLPSPPADAPRSPCREPSNASGPRSCIDGEPVS